MTSVFGGTLNLTHLNCSLQEQLVQVSTTHSHFNQYCIIYCNLVIERLLNPALKSAVSAPSPT